MTGFIHTMPRVCREDGAYRARSTHTPEHVARVAAIVADFPGARTTGLSAAVDELRGRLGRAGHFPPVTFIPDAFRLNEAESEIELYEVEVTHPLTMRKLRVLGEWWAAWDAEGDHDWLPVLIQVDRFGDRHRRDLGIAYFETLGEAA